MRGASARQAEGQMGVWRSFIGASAATSRLSAMDSMVVATTVEANGFQRIELPVSRMPDALREGYVGFVWTGERSAEQLIRHFHLNPANRYPQIFLNAASQLTDSRLWLLALGALLYSLFRFTEAVGLWYQKRWAEWLGLFSGSLYVPIEVYELFEGVSWPKVLVLAVNLLIVAYLANILVRSSREQGRAGSSGPTPASDRAAALPRRP